MRRTPLHIAIMADSRSVFEILLNHEKTNLNLKTAEEHPPLYYALTKYESGDDSEDSYASLLIEKSADTNPIYSQTSDSLLQVLILNGAEKAAVFLLDHISDLDHANAKGETALHVACVKNCPRVVEKLMEMGADANVPSRESRWSPLHCCVVNNAVDCVRVFVRFRERVNFNGRDANGDTPVSLALSEGRNELVPVLIEGGADVNVRNGKDFTLLHQAILKEDSKTAIFLLDNGADINAQ